jgi:16S rRNA (guanine527-N7)-methyltransferase
LSSGDLLEALYLGLTELGEDPARHPCQAYLDYLALLCSWNRAYSLTGIREPSQMLSRHILDSLAVLPYVRGPACLDVGSGAGIPGMILALARPGSSWVLLDSNLKKTRFLRQAVLELRIANVTVVRSRIEEYRPVSPFTTIIGRALGTLPEFYRLASGLVATPGRLIAMKGQRPDAEVLEMQQAGIDCKIHVLQVPGLNRQRHLVVMDRS